MDPAAAEYPSRIRRFERRLPTGLAPHSFIRGFHTAYTITRLQINIWAHTKLLLRNYPQYSRSHARFVIFELGCIHEADELQRSSLYSSWYLLCM
jgi:hypothetical protein